MNDHFTTAEMEPMIQHIVLLMVVGVAEKSYRSKKRSTSH